MLDTVVRATLSRVEALAPVMQAWGQRMSCREVFASAPELQAEASIGVQDCARGAAAHSVDCDVPEELEAIIGKLWRCLKRLCGSFMP